MTLHHSTSSNTGSPLHSSKLSQFWGSLKLDRFPQACLSIANVFVNALNTNREPQLVWKRDRQRRSYLEMYDPTTEMHWYFQSEEDARVWLEQRYYTKHNSAIKQLLI